jgi:hypothetical protein
MKKIKKLVSHLEESIFNVIPEVGEKIEEMYELLNIFIKAACHFYIFLIPTFLV